MSASGPTDAGPLAPGRALLTDRVAVVTGAARGIGASTAQALAAFGAHLAVCDRDGDGLDATAEAVEDLDRRVVTAELDVRDAEAVEGFCARANEELGPLDVLVNNAGGGFHAPFMDVTPKGQDALVRENFSSVTHFVRAAVPRMTNGGSIVNVTSIEAHRAGPGFAVYSAMKAAVANLTQSLALELADRRIRVNCVAPDMIPTPGDAELAAEVAARAERTWEPTVWPDRATAEDCAAAIVFLAGDLARFVTGSTLPVDGGNLAAAGWKRTPAGWTL